MTRTADGSYHGRVTLPDPGMVRIAVRAAGKTVEGKPFTDEAIVTNDFLIVKPVVARFRSLRERAAGTRGSAQFDRLEVSAELEVIEPGEYIMTFTLRDPGGASLSGARTSGSAKLLAGLRELTVAVPGRKPWSGLRDGPFEITAVRIWRTIPLASSSSWVEVPTGGASLHTAAYTRNRWDPGAFLERIGSAYMGSARLRRADFASPKWSGMSPPLAARAAGMAGLARTSRQPAARFPFSLIRDATCPQGEPKSVFSSTAASLPPCEAQSSVYRGDPL